MLELNFTVIIQLAMILSLLAILSQIAFKPFLKVLEERKERVERAEIKARELRKRTEELMVRYREALADAQAQGVAEREKIRKQSLTREMDVLQKAVEEANRRIQEMKNKIAEETGTAKASLRLQAQNLSREIAAKVLGRNLQ
jgi:F-type H+-transporting ATPase subunit b